LNRTPVYGETFGLSSNWIYHAIQKLLKARLHEKIEDAIPKTILTKYHLPSLSTALVWIHSPKKDEDALSARKRFSFEEIFFIQLSRQKERRIYRANPTFHIELTKESAPTNYVMVDGLGVGDVGTVVLRDRQQLAEDGMFVIITVVNAKTGKVIGSPDIISRGFIYLRESKELLYEARKRVKFIIEKATMGEHPINEMHIKEEVRKKLGQFLFSKTQRNPMVLPVIIEV